MKFNLDNLVTEYENLDRDLANPEVYSDPKKLKDLMQKKKSLELSVTLYREYKQFHANIDEAKNMLATEKDSEMIAMAKEEMLSSEIKITELEEKLKIALLPKDPNDEKNLIFEVRAGTGGDEAALFARELANAYIIFTKAEGYSLEIIEEAENEAGGLKEIVMKIS